MYIPILYIVNMDIYCISTQTYIYISIYTNNETATLCSPKAVATAQICVGLNSCGECLVIIINRCKRGLVLESQNADFLIIQCRQRYLFKFLSNSNFQFQLNIEVRFLIFQHRYVLKWIRANCERAASSGVLRLVYKFLLLAT